MERTPVQSSIIRSVGHNPSTGILEIEFSTGRVYQYHSVHARKAAELLGAKSVGAHFKAHIHGKHKHTEIEPQ